MGVATHAVWYLQSETKQIPCKGHKHFSNWLQQFLSTCCCCCELLLLLLLLRSIFICHVALTGTPSACPLLLAACLPACLLLLRLILRALALIILIIIPIYARKYLRFTAYFSLDSSRFCFVLPFLPTSLSRSPSLPLFLPLSCSFFSLYLTRNATSRNENV